MEILLFKYLNLTICHKIVAVFPLYYYYFLFFSFIRTKFILQFYVFYKIREEIECQQRNNKNSKITNLKGRKQ